MPTLLDDFDSDEMTLCRRPAVPRAHVAIVKSDTRSPTHRHMPKSSGILKALRRAFDGVEKSDEQADAIDSALATVEAELEDSTELETSAEVAELAATEIGKMAELRKSLETERTALQDLRKQIEDEREAVAVAKSEADAREMLGIVSGDVSAIASLLRKSSPEEREALAASYKSAAAIAKSAPETRFARMRVLKSGEESLESVAKSLQEKDPKLTAEQASVKASQIRPDLYEAEVRESRRAAASEGY